MAIKIIDGRGTGQMARVDEEGRIFVLGVQESPIEHASIVGDAYLVQTPKINLTTANASAVLYLTNTSSEKLMVLQEMRTFLGGSNSSGDVELIGYKNPTGGTLISAGTVLTPNNQNLGNTVPAQATALYGAEGSAITGGTEMIGAIVQDTGSAGVDLNFAVPNGASFAITITPPTGNTSMDFRLRLAFYYDELHTS